MTDPTNANQPTEPEDGATPETGASAPQDSTGASAAATEPLQNATVPAEPTPPPNPYADELGQSAAAGQPYAQPAGAAPQQNPYAQPTQPYAGQPVHPPTGANGTNPYTNQPYAQQPNQQPYAGGYPPTTPPPYGAQPGYPYPQQPQKRKIWPWVLGGCLLVIVLGLGGCVGCATVAANIYDNATDYSYGHRYGEHSGRYSYDDSSSYSSDMGSFTLDEIEELGADLPNTVIENRCTPGVYEVGATGDLTPGLYYLEGSQTEESLYYLFEMADDKASYNLDDSVVYFGNYFAELEEGDVIVYGGPADSHMYQASSAPTGLTAPYQSGCYRVGTDIPAGTYSITAQAQLEDISASGSAAAYVMDDLDFDSDSITETKYVVPGGTQTVTVKDGDYLELYLAVATPA